MKKIFGIFIACTMLLAVCACGSTPSTEGESAPPASERPVSDSNSAENDSASGSSEPSASGQDILIAYFSWSGNTERLAEMIQSEAGGDLFEIETVEPYTDDYDALLDQAQQEQRDNARPELAQTVDNWESYDTIFVGYPNWWGDAPMAVRTFLESYDCSGKTIIPFNTSGGGGFGRSLSAIEESASGATISEGFTIDGDSVDDAAEDVSEWILGLGLTQ